MRIPAGVATGSKVRVPGKGRTEEGDLYVSLTVEPHPYFGREGDDILAEVPVTVSEAYLGAEIDVPTIHGPVRARDPAPGPPAGQRFRLKGYGVRTRGPGATATTPTGSDRDAGASHGRGAGGGGGEVCDGSTREDPRAGLPEGL